eukprot:PhM_4_TR256/c0_g1_i1/m.105160
MFRCLSSLLFGCGVRCRNRFIGFVAFLDQLDNLLLGLKKGLAFALVLLELEVDELRPRPGTPPLAAKPSLQRDYTGSISSQPPHNFHNPPRRHQRRQYEIHRSALPPNAEGQDEPPQVTSEDCLRPLDAYRGSLGARRDMVNEVRRHQCQDRRIREATSTFNNSGEDTQRTCETNRNGHGAMPLVSVKTVVAELVLFFLQMFAQNVVVQLGDLTGALFPGFMPQLMLHLPVFDFPGVTSVVALPVHNTTAPIKTSAGLRTFVPRLLDFAAKLRASVPIRAESVEHARHVQLCRFATDSGRRTYMMLRGLLEPLLGVVRPSGGGLQLPWHLHRAPAGLELVGHRRPRARECPPAASSGQRCEEVIRTSAAYPCTSFRVERMETCVVIIIVVDISVVGVAAVLIERIVQYSCTHGRRLFVEDAREGGKGTVKGELGGLGRCSIRLPD